MTHTTHIWLRAETKLFEARTPLVPNDAKRLLEAGYKINVEKSPQRIIPDADYAAAGCELVEQGDWNNASKDDFVLGIKELEESNSPLSHRHIYFAHAFKEQEGWQNLLKRFKTGGGEILDIEYLVDENGRRVSTFGHWAGYAGAAVAVMTWRRQHNDPNKVNHSFSAYPEKQLMLHELTDLLDRTGKKPDLIVIGAKGRVGGGAVELGRTLGLEVTEWDMQETAKGGPFTEILQHDIFINAVLLAGPMPPFLTFEQLSSTARKLSVISDVSCDPNSPHNPLPIYTQPTSFDNPVINIDAGEKPLSLLAIDHLPSLLPREASEDFSAQLIEALLQLNNPNNGVWQRARQVFHDRLKQI